MPRLDPTAGITRVNLEGQSKGYLPILVKRGKNPIFQGVRAFLVFNLKKNADYQSLSIVINSYQSLSIWCYQRCYQIDVKKRDGNTTAFKKSLEMQNFKNIKK